MSLFRAKEWWASPPTSETDVCVCNHKSMVIMRMHDEGDSLAVGDFNGHLKIFRPKGSYQPSDLCLEIKLQQPILQIGSGKFMTDSDKDLIAVLTPRQLLIYSFHTKEGHTDYGDQHVLVERYHHKLPWNAYCFVSGNFGGIVNRELICVQSMDGWLIFYDQEMTLFSCLLPEIIIPGPLEYVTKSDSFVTFGSGWTINFYSYLHLSQIGDVNEDHLHSARKMTAEWIFNIGENILSLQSVQISNDTSAIFALGERYLHCIHDNGILRFMKTFDFKPRCCFAYLVGWYYEPNSRLLYMVASENALHIYENTSLLWSCELSFAPVAVAKGYFKGLAAGMSLLGINGNLTCSYLGTEPDLFVPPPLPEKSNFNVKKLEEEIEVLQQAMERLNSEEEIHQINLSVEKGIHIYLKFHKACDRLDCQGSELLDSQLFLCGFDVIINLNIDIENLSVSFVCQYPLLIHKTILTVEDISKNNSIHNFLYVDEDVDFVSSDITVVIICVDKNGQIRTLEKMIMIPKEFMFKFCAPVKEAAYKITITTNYKNPLNLRNLFFEGNSGDGDEKQTALGLCKINENDSVTIIPAKTNQRFRFQSDNISSLYIIIKDFLRLLTLRNLQSQETSKQTELQVHLYGAIGSDILNTFFNCINAHAESKLLLTKLRADLNILTRQFILIQKRLLVKYCAYPPANCEGLEFLMKDTFKRISDTNRRVLEQQLILSRRGCQLSTSIKLILLLLKISGLKIEELSALYGALSPDIFTKEYQDWEEIVCQSVPHLLRTEFAKPDKSSDKLTPLSNEDILMDANIKKLIKYIKVLFDRAMKMCEMNVVKTTFPDPEALQENEDQDAAEEFLEEK